MKLLFCIKAMNNPGGGAERVLADLANELVNRGHSIKILTFERQGNVSFYQLDGRIERICLGVGTTTEKSTAVETARRLHALRAALKQQRPDVAVGFMHSMFIVLGMAALGTGIPIIASEHIVPEHYQSRPVERLLLQTTPYLVRSITCTSAAVKRCYPAGLQRKMIAIRNPVTVRPPMHGDQATSDRPKRILSVGRLEEQKDFPTLIRAFAAIEPKFPDWHLRIVGEGSLRQSLEALASELGIASKCMLPGATRDIGREYEGAQLFVLPSRYESFGLTTIEAMLHGLPAIGFSDCPGTNTLIAHGVDGVLVDSGPDRVKHLAEALTKALSDPAWRNSLAINALDKAREFDVTAVATEWEKLLQSTVHEAR